MLIVSYETQRRYSNLFAKKKTFGSTNTNTASVSSTPATNANADTDGMDDEDKNLDPKSKYVRLKKTPSNNICDLLICDEAHKLKNAESGLSKALNILPVKKRILLSGTPMQNDLVEFYNMVSFCNPDILGTVSEFKRKLVCPYCLFSYLYLYLYLYMYL